MIKPPLNRPMAFLYFFILTLLALPTNALYFYMDAQTPKCFFEELPKDTLVVGHYKTEQYNPQNGMYMPATEPLEISITVEEIFDNDHRVVNNRSPPNGRFTFTAADAGDHRICFTTVNGPNHGGWLTGGLPAGGIRFTLDMAIGDTSELESADKGKMDDLEAKVRDLNNRLQGIRKEQVFQREREAEFRDQSESTNSRVVRWSLIQLAVLGITCAWQLSNLRAFFIKQKLT